MEKEVRLDHERKIKVFVGNNQSSLDKQITEIFTADGLECANYSFVQGDKVLISASLDIDLESEENKNKLTFEIDINHPLYFAFLHLLNGKDELTINDEKQENKDLKYLSIRNEEDLITLNFIDKIRNENLRDRFTIRYNNSRDYKGSMYVISRNDTKTRMNEFFEEATKLLFEDSHQISFEEYDIQQKIKEKQIS